MHCLISIMNGLMFPNLPPDPNGRQMAFFCCFQWLWPKFLSFAAMSAVNEVKTLYGSRNDCSLSSQSFTTPCSPCIPRKRICSFQQTRCSQRRQEIKPRMMLDQ